MICPVCQGSGSIVSFRFGPQYWPCPCCHDAGVIWQAQPRNFRHRHRKPKDTPND